jgi:hypothetical protein
LKTALSVVGEMKNQNLLDSFENGGKLDAFRHIFTMAFLSQNISVKKLSVLGKAHEKGNYLQFTQGKLEYGELPDSVSCEMDLLNNEIGFELGVKFKKVDLDSLRNIVLAAIRTGSAWMIKRNSKGEYLKCDDSILRISEWKGMWGIPKCLTKSR